MGDSRAGWRTVREPATWVIADSSPTDDRLRVVAGWGGGGKYHHTEVVETSRRVRIEVLIQHSVASDPTVRQVRTLELRFAVIEVRLARSLGGRLLDGGSEDSPVGRSLLNLRARLAGHAPMDIVDSTPAAADPS